MIKLKKFNNEAKIKKLYREHFEKDLDVNNQDIIYCLYNNKNVVGYVIYKITTSGVYIDWIYAPNYGKIFMEKLERKFKKDGHKKILLNLSIDPTENSDTVMRRINFYISLQYKVYNIKFREKYGPLLYMQKVL